MDHPELPILDRRPWLERIIGTVPGIRWLISGIVTVTIACAIVMRLIDEEEFPDHGTGALVVGADRDHRRRTAT